MGKARNELYFLAIVPPEPVFSIVQNFKLEVANRFGSKAALKSPPHITLQMPFQYPKKKEGLIYAALNEIKLTDEIVLYQHGFGAFPPRVIYVNVEESEPLRDLQKRVTTVMRTKLNILNTNYKDHAFRPHMTIAFRDLKKSVFPQAMKYYKEEELHLSWKTSSFWLMKHNGLQWEQHKEFLFISND